MGRKKTVEVPAAVPEVILEPDPELGQDEIYSPWAPGLPPSGIDFNNFVRASMIVESNQKTLLTPLATAEQVLHDAYYDALRTPGFTLPIKTGVNMFKHVCFVPGHIWGQSQTSYADGNRTVVDGPHPAEVMVIGKMPGQSEVSEGRNMVGVSGQLLVETIRRLHITGSPDWYVTNLLKFQPPTTDGRIKSDWIADCLPLLYEEILLVRPKYILCLGSDASKALLGPKATVESMDGRVMEMEFDARMSVRSVPQKHKVMVMTVIHPAAVSRAPEQLRRLERGLSRFDMLRKGIRFDLAEEGIDHRTVRTLTQLQDLLYEIDHDPEKTDKWIAVDAEWHGEHPQNQGSYVRTIQLAWRPKRAAAIVWSDTEGKCAFTDDEGRPAHKQAVEMLNAFFADKRIAGHFLVADLEWLTHIGMDMLLERFKVPLQPRRFDLFDPDAQETLSNYGYRYGDVVPAVDRTIVEGGWDTGLAAHVIEETALLGLETLAMRYTTVPRYDLPLNEWKSAYCKSKGIKAKDLEGYGPCPDEVIIPYGVYDADTTLRLMYEQMPLIEKDYEGNNCRESFWESMIIVGPILEMHQVGIPCDRERIDFQTAAFMKWRYRQEIKLKEWAKWPEFNIRSVQEVKEFLFGEYYNGKKSTDGQVVRIRPVAAPNVEPGVSLGLEPILDTSKPPQRWADIKAKGLDRERNPTTNKMALSILAQDNLEAADQVNWIRDYRFLDQVLKSVLRPPATDDKGVTLREGASPANFDIEADNSESPFGIDNLGGVIYDAGLAASQCDDGRIRTHFYQTAETKRWKSARPGIHNLAKRRDPDYARLLGGTKDANGNWVGGDYKYKLRSLFCPLPGHVLIEADYKGAELYIMAIMSGDPLMIEHATRAQLDETDPLFYDIHSNVAVLAFHLDCEPTKKGLKSIGKVSLRIAAKNVIFGIAYGRGAKAIALQCKEEGNPISVDQAQQIIDAVFAMYPGLVPLFDEARKRSANPGWLCGIFGGYRRFPYTTDRTLKTDFEREAMNFIIQNGVASVVDRAFANMEDYRQRTLKDPDFFKFAAQIHDAVLLHVPYANVEVVMEEVLPINMTDRVPIYPTTLDGSETGAGPYHLSIDKEVYHHWGEPIDEDFCLRYEIPVKYAG